MVQNNNSFSRCKISFTNLQFLDLFISGFTPGLTKTQWDDRLPLLYSNWSQIISFNVETVPLVDVYFLINS